MALSERDLAAIRDLVEKDAEAVRRSDWTTVADLFTEDAVRYPAHHPPIRGREAMRSWLETFPAIAHFAITADEIIGCEDTAFVRGTYAIAFGQDDGSAVTDRGNYLGLVRKQSDGAWRWVSDMASSELPLPTP